MNFFSRERAGDIYFTGLLLLAASLPLSLFVMSIAQFVLIGSFILEGNYLQRLKRFFLNRPAVIITGIFAMHLVGLAWTEDFSWGRHDIVMKLPLLVLPFVISTSPPLSRKKFEFLMTVFVLAVFAGTMISVAVFIGIISRPINDIRDIFILGISHIRFALLTCIAIFSSAYFLYKNSGKWTLIKKITASFLIAWLITFLIIAESVTGLFILFATTIVVGLFLLFKNKKTYVRLIIGLFLAVISVFSFSFLKNVYKEITTVHSEDVSTPEAITKRGNPYGNYPLETQRENGYLVWMYICEPELREEWNKRSSFHYDSLDERNQMLRFTLIRFLASKGLRKDAEGLLSLSDKEIRSVEKGITNINYQGATNLRARIHQLFVEYKVFLEGGNPSGYSVAQRLEYWKAAWGIVRENIFFGVGTGDIVKAYPPQYEKMKSRLESHLRLRAHNQYLTFAATFGIFGLLYFIFSLVFPISSLNKSCDFLYMTFWLIAALSMLSEDTLETQAGVTFFAFFNCLFLFAHDDGK